MDPIAAARAYLGIPKEETKWYSPEDAGVAAAQLKALLGADSPVIPLRGNELVTALMDELEGYNQLQGFIPSERKYRLTPTGLEILNKPQLTSAAYTNKGIVYYAPGADDIGIRAHEREHVAQEKRLGSKAVNTMADIWKPQYLSRNNPVEEPARLAEDKAWQDRRAYILAQREAMK